MTVNMNVQVMGVREALVHLRKTDTVLANNLRGAARQIMKPLVTDAKASIPDVALSNMANPWTSKKSGAQLLPWDGDKARRYVKAKTSTKKPQQYGPYVRNLAVFYVSWAGGVNMMFDMAGRVRGSIMANNLTDKFGPPSRVMWPAAERNQQQIQDEMQGVIDEFMHIYQRVLTGAL